MSRTFSILPDASDMFGRNGGILFIGLMLTLPLMLITNPIAVIFGIISAFVLGSLLMIYTNSQFFGVSSIIVWVAIAGGILIWKITRR